MIPLNPNPVDPARTDVPLLLPTSRRTRRGNVGFSVESEIEVGFGDHFVKSVAPRVKVPCGPFAHLFWLRNRR